MTRRKWLSTVLAGALLCACLPGGMKTAALDVSPQNRLTRAQAECIEPATGANAARDNRERIQYCLDTYKVAKLGDGVFNVDGKIEVGDNCLLTAVNTTWPTIRAVSPVNYLLDVSGNNSSVSLLTIDYNHQYIMGGYPCRSVVGIEGSNNQISNCHIRGGAAPQRWYNALTSALKTVTGVYFVNPECTGNTIYNCQIYNNTYGSIFVAGLTKNSTANNKLENCRVYYNRSDGITIAGYGEVIGCVIHHNGFDCMNGTSSTIPIPGANIYALTNRNGALIRNNEIYDSNGNGVDIVECCDFVIEGNDIYDPGCRYFPDAEDYQYCSYGSGVGMILCDVQQCVVEDNTISNHRATNKVGDAPYPDATTNKFFAASGAAAYSDLPDGPNQVIAFVLAESCGTDKHTTGNVIRNNRFRSAPDGNGATGLGYFTSRGTGFGVYGSTSDDEWSASTTNYFTLNTPFGSHIGSVRGGGNWFAANGEDQNSDDDQHQPPYSDWTGSDNDMSHY